MIADYSCATMITNKFWDENKEYFGLKVQLCKILIPLFVKSGEFTGVPIIHSNHVYNTKSGKFVGTYITKEASHFNNVSCDETTKGQEYSVGCEQNWIGNSPKCQLSGLVVAWEIAFSLQTPCAHWINWFENWSLLIGWKWWTFKYWTWGIMDHQPVPMVQPSTLLPGTLVIPYSPLWMSEWDKQRVIVLVSYDYPDQHIPQRMSKNLHLFVG